MIEIDKIYVLSLSNIGEVKVFAICETTAEKVATYLLGRKVRLHLLCRTNRVSIILKESLHGKMISEISSWLRGDPVDEFSFCESMHATGTSPWHIRKLTAQGRKLGGGADTVALCGREVAWDLEVKVTPEFGDFVCSKCVDEFQPLSMKRTTVEKIARLAAGTDGNCPCNCHNPEVCKVSEPFDHHDCTECWVSLIEEICSEEDE